MRRDIKNEIKFNYENMQKIDKKYDSLITDIVCYIRIKLNEEDSEEAINDILDMFLEAQEREESLYDFIGGDYKEFCKEIILEYKGNSKTYEILKFKTIVLSIIKVIPIFVALDCIINLGNIRPLNLNSIWNSSFKLKLLPLLGVLVAIPMVYLIFNLIIYKKGEKKKCLFIFLGNVFYIAILFLIDYYFRKFIIISIPNYFICFTISIIILIIFLIWNIMLFNDLKIRNKE